MAKDLTQLFLPNNATVMISVTGTSSGAHYKLGLLSLAQWREFSGDLIGLFPTKANVQSYDDRSGWLEAV